MKKKLRKNNFGEPKGSKVRLKKNYGGWLAGIILEVEDERKRGKYHKILVKNVLDEQMSIPTKYLKR